MQHAILDLAKPVIAVTLGGGTSAREGSSRNVTTGFLLVAVTHLLRGTKAHWAQRHPLPPAAVEDPSRRRRRARLRLRALRQERSARMDEERTGDPHLTQGIVRYIREWYIRREKANASTQGLVDPEAGKSLTAGSSGSSDGPETGFTTPDTDAGFQPATAGRVDGVDHQEEAKAEHAGPAAAAAVGRRASTKIVVMKEYELSRAAEEAAGTNATDVHNLGNAPFNKQPAQIWISYIGCDEVCFGTSRFPTSEDPPFYVKVNSAVWQPRRIYPLDDEDATEGYDSGRHRQG